MNDWFEFQTATVRIPKRKPPKREPLNEKEQNLFDDIMLTALDAQADVTRKVVDWIEESEFISGQKVVKIIEAIADRNERLALSIALKFAYKYGDVLNKQRYEEMIVGDK